MIDYFTVLNKRGYVLYTQHFAKLKVNAIDALIRDVLLEERGGDNSYTIGPYSLKWTFANEYELIFVVVYQKSLSLVYIEDLLAEAKKAFCEEFTALNCNAHSLVSIPFEDQLSRILDEVETTSKKRSVVQKKFSETEKAKGVGSQSTKEDTPKPKKADDKGKADGKDNKDKKDNKDNKDKDDPEETLEERIERKRREFAERQVRGGKKAPKQVEPVEQPKPRVKAGREWDDVIRKEDAAKLNRSNHAKASAPLEEIIPQKQEKIVLEDLETDSSNSSMGFFQSYFGGLTGNKVLTAADLESVLLKFKQHLMEKNVAAEIADKLCQSVGASLEGKKISTFQGITSTVKTALEESLTRILTPKRHIDILREVAAVKGERPYTITFCGVNGVGKSTNLAKVSAWLMQNGLTVMLAACDTFRAGAVEQLGVHAKKLGIMLYERGYGKDAAGIAADAISFAKEKKIDVVLIDTAGRMQHNEPLMRSLAKLVNINKVDLVLFVGEALVGNDGVDQLVTFNKALADLSTTVPPRVVDGIILTKFDTIDDKVGAAISMVYSTGQPIVFLGTGQHYTDLKKMSVATVIKTLLK